MTTIDIPYSLRDKTPILRLMENQNCVIRFVYNRLQDRKKLIKNIEEENKILSKNNQLEKEIPKELTQKELTILVNSMNNITVDSWFKQSAVYKAKQLNENADNLIFGGKKLFEKRRKGKITYEQFQLLKLMPLYIIGESSNQGNRKFEFKIIEGNYITFMPKQGVEIKLQLPKLRNNYRKILHKLQILAEQKEIPITIQIDMKKIYITYDETCLQEKYVGIPNRVMAIDSNPNSSGFSIIDYKSEDDKKIIKAEIFSTFNLNTKEFELKFDKVSSDDPQMIAAHDKRDFEIYEISKRLVNIAKHYKVDSFAIEDLSIDPCDNHKGKKYNRLVNNMWNRGKFFSNLEKRLNIAGIKLYKMQPQYSSFIGNMLNREYPDAINASIEISRRCYCLKNRIKPVIFPDIIKSMKQIKLSLEELFGSSQNFIDEITSWVSLYKQVIKKSELRYRISLEDCKKSHKVLSLFNKKSLVEEIQFV